MMQRKQSSARSRLRALALLPAAVAAILLASAPAVASAAHSSLPEKKVETKVEKKAEPVEKTDMLSGLNPDNKCLIIIDGVKYPDKSDLSFIDQDIIESVTVDKTARAVETYGEAAKNGVIIVTTKNAPAEIKNQKPEPVPSAEVTVSDADVEVRTRKVVSVGAGSEQVVPTYPGGEEALYKVMSRLIRYPAEAAQKNIQGKVIVSFRVLKDGSIDSVKVARGVDPQLDAEAVRVIKALGKFNPAKHNGEPVNAWYTMPISFKLGGVDDDKLTDHPVGAKDGDIVPAQYPGGQVAMMKYLMNNVKYPAEAVEAKAEGKVIVGVMVAKDGHQMMTGIADNPTGNFALANEAFRVVKAMGNFTPATRNGQPIEYYLAIPVTFRLK